MRLILEVKDPTEEVLRYILYHLSRVYFAIAQYDVKKRYFADAQYDVKKRYFACAQYDVKKDIRSRLI